MDRRLEQLTTALQWMFAAWVVFLGVGIAFRAIERSLLSRAAENRFSVTPAEALASDHRLDTFANVSIAAVVVTGIVFIVWFHRAYRRTRALGGEMRYSDGWAIGAWFIPIGNLWIPKKLANDIWWGSAPRDERTWSERSALLAAWWCAWVVGGLITWFTRVDYTRLEDSEVNNLNDFLRSNLAATVALAVTLLAAAFAVVVVRQIGQRLAERTAAVADRLAAETQPPAVPSTPSTLLTGSELEATVPSKQRRQPWLLIGATVAAVALAVGTVVIIAGTASSNPRTAPVAKAPPVAAEPVPPDFERHDSYADDFAISIPSTWMSFDLSGPDVEAALDDAALTDPDVADYLRQQQEVGALPSFAALETSPALAIRPPGQIQVMRLPTEGLSLAEGAAALEQQIASDPTVVGAVSRERVALPAGNAHVLSFEHRLPDALDDQVIATTVYLLVAGPTVYVITLGGAPEDAGAQRPIFDAVIGSFEISP